MLYLLPDLPEGYSDEQKIEAYHQLAPDNGTAFHDPAHLELFSSCPPWMYEPNDAVRARFNKLQAVVSIMGAFTVGKNAAKSEAVAIASHEEYAQIFPGGVHEVLSGTTRLPEIRDKELEDHTNYLFCFEKHMNKMLVDWFLNGDLVQWTQPRGDHVYFSTIASYPTEGVALLDTVPATLYDLQRVMAPTGKQPLGLYRTVATFEDWWARLMERQDVIDKHGNIIDKDNYNKRMKEAVISLTEANDMGDLVKFFEAPTRRKAGKKVLEIVANPDAYTREKQSIARRGAFLMLKGLEERGFKAA